MKAVNGALTMGRLAVGARSWHGRDMTDRPSAAGGFFLIVAIIAGFFWGVGRGDPLGGALLGTLVGIAIAVAVWLVDRRRSRRPR